MLNNNDELYNTKSIDLSAGVTPTPADAPLQLHFTIEGGTGSGTITDAGVLTATTPGTIIVKVVDQNSGLESELTVTVCSYTAATEITATVPETGNTLNPDGELYNTKSIQLNIAKTPSGADAKYTFATQTGTTAAVTISSDGVVTASDYGIAIIKVTDVLSGEESTVELDVCEYEAPDEFTPDSVEPLSTAANCPVNVMTVQLYNPEGGKTGLVNIKPKVTVTGTDSEDVETLVVLTGGGDEDQCGYYFTLQADSAAEGTFTIRVEDEISGLYAERQVTFAEVFASAISIDAQSGRVAAGGEKDLGVSTTPQYCETELSFTVSDSLGEVVTRYNGLKPNYVFVAGNTAGSGTITVTDQLSSQTATCGIEVLSN